MENTENIEQLKEQLKVARTELYNLRQKIQNVTKGHHRDIEKIQNEIKNWQCQNCKISANVGSLVNHVNLESPADEVRFKPIGVIHSNFPDKKGTPRQPIVGSQVRGKIELFPDIFTNPSHAIEGLEGFSHMWIVFHFHKHTSHAHSKVAPPRLNGARVGVFSSRSPHRPNPIGISLVRIDRIDGATIEFLGVDMIDGTPVLDIKPYIPAYDCPNAEQNSSSKVCISNKVATPDSSFDRTTASFDEDDIREAPDGEEGREIPKGAISLQTLPSHVPLTIKVNPLALYDIGGGDASSSSANHMNNVRVPDWITNKTSVIVTFTEKALSQIHELNGDKQSILQVLQADPRSVYLRRRYGGQFFTFLMQNLHVTCRFQDDVGACTVMSVRRAEHVSEGHNVTSSEAEMYEKD